MIHEDFKINYDKTLVIVIDMVKGFTDIGSLKSPYIKSLGEKLRDKIYKFSNKIAINDSHSLNDVEFNSYPHHCIKGSSECEIIDELKDIHFDHILFKNSTNGFFSEGFMDVISPYIDKDFSFLVCGCCTDICILQFVLTFKGHLNSINKNLDIIIDKSLVETYDSIDHGREYANDISFYLMDKMGIILKKDII